MSLSRIRSAAAGLALLTAATAAGSLAMAPAASAGVPSAARVMAPAGLGSDDYPYRTSTPDRNDPWGFYTRECTSFVAWRLRHDLGVPKFTNGYKGGLFGNAKHWAVNARNLHLRVDGTASRGAVAVFGPGVAGAGYNGHVAVVLSAANGKMTVEEYNFGHRFGYGKRTISTKGVSFIHF